MGPVGPSRYIMSILGILTSELLSCNLSMLSDMVERILDSRRTFTNYSNQDYNLGILTSELPSCSLSMLSEMVVRKQIRQWIYNIYGYYNRGKTKNSYWSVCSSSRRGKMGKGIWLGVSIFKPAASFTF